MNDKALGELRKRTIVNAFDKEYPHMRPTINSLVHHIEIFKLIDEYIGLYEDLSNVRTQSSKDFMRGRMDQIGSELTNYWIVPDNEMVPKERR